MGLRETPAAVAFSEPALGNIGRRRCPGALSGSVLAVSLLGQILRSFPKFSSTCSGFCDFMTPAELGELAADR